MEAMNCSLLNAWVSVDTATVHLPDSVAIWGHNSTGMRASAAASRSQVDDTECIDKSTSSLLSVLTWPAAAPMDFTERLVLDAAARTACGKTDLETTEAISFHSSVSKPRIAAFLCLAFASRTVAAPIKPCIVRVTAASSGLAMVRCGWPTCHGLTRPRPWAPSG